MTTIYAKTKNKLVEHPTFRERRFRANGLMILALRELGLEMKYKAGEKLSMESLIDLAKKYDSYRHEWDSVMRDFSDLRGSDYGDKDEYEQKAQQSFGYESGFRELSKLSNKL